MRQCFALYDEELVWLEHFKGSGAYVQRLKHDTKRKIVSVLVPRSEVTVLTPEEAAKYYYKETK